MEMKERLFYVGLLLIEFVLILFVLYHVRNRPNTMENATSPGFGKAPSYNRLYSFDGVNQIGTEEHVRFSAYADQMYLFVVVSSECSHCSLFLDQFSQDLQQSPLQQAVQVIALTSNNLTHFAKYNDFHFLRTSFDDLQQFGKSVPSVFLVDGQGNVLFTAVGYRSDLLKHITNAIVKFKTRKSESID